MGQSQRVLSADLRLASARRPPVPGEDTAPPAAGDGVGDLHKFFHSRTFRAHALHEHESAEHFTCESDRKHHQYAFGQRTVQVTERIHLKYETPVTP